jgi:hypothetical protein
MRTLCLNIKAKDNPGLREAIINGDLTEKELIKMSPAVCDKSCFILKFYLRLYYRKWLLMKRRQSTDVCRKSTYSKLVEPN